jgi:hypothetical protein
MRWLAVALLCLAFAACSGGSEATPTAKTSPALTATEAEAAVVIYVDRYKTLPQYGARFRVELCHADDHSAESWFVTCDLQDPYGQMETVKQWAIFRVDSDGAVTEVTSPTASPFS